MPCCPAGHNHGFVGLAQFVQAHALGRSCSPHGVHAPEQAILAGSRLWRLLRAHRQWLGLLEPGTPFRTAVPAAICLRCLCRWRTTMDTMIKRRRLLATLCAVLVAAVAVGSYGGPAPAAAGVQAAGKPSACTTP